MSKREVEVSSCLSKRADLSPGIMQPISFDVPPGVDGVLTVTVWDEKDVPLAERLIFREPALSIAQHENQFLSEAIFSAAISKRSFSFLLNLAIVTPCSSREIY